MATDLEKQDVWLDRKLGRRSLLKKAAIGGAGVAVMYVAPSFTSTSAGKAYATTGDAGPGCDEVGRATTLKIRYTGDDPAAGGNSQAGSAWGVDGAVGGAVSVFIEANNYNGSNNTQGFSGVVASGAEFLIGSTGPGGKVGPNTEIFVYENDGGSKGDYLSKVWFHTSCSQPLEVGDAFGTFVVTEFNG